MSAAKPQELDAWIVQTAPRAVAYAASLLRDRTAAEDIVQDCYCRLLQKADSYDLLHDGTKILFRSITNACINQTTRRRTLLSLDTPGDPERGGLEVADRDAQKPERILMNQELEHAVADALARLPEMHRAALELKSLGHSQQEIADTLDITATYAGVLIHRARQTMAQYLAPHLGEAVG